MILYIKEFYCILVVIVVKYTISFLVSATESKVLLERKFHLKLGYLEFYQTIVNRSRHLEGRWYLQRNVKKTKVLYGFSDIDTFLLS